MRKKVSSDAFCGVWRGPPSPGASDGRCAKRSPLRLRRPECPPQPPPVVGVRQRLGGFGGFVFIARECLWCRVQIRCLCALPRFPPNSRRERAVTEGPKHVSSHIALPQTPSLLLRTNAPPTLPGAQSHQPPAAQLATRFHLRSDIISRGNGRWCCPISVKDTCPTNDTPLENNATQMARMQPRRSGLGEGHAPRQRRYRRESSSPRRAGT